MPFKTLVLKGISAPYGHLQNKCFEVCKLNALHAKRLLEHEATFVKKSISHYQRILIQV